MLSVGIGLKMANAQVPISSHGICKVLILIAKWRIWDSTDCSARGSVPFAGYFEE